MLTDAGLGAAKAGQIAGLIGIAAMAGRLLVGALLDRLPPSAVTAGVFVLAALGMVMLASGGAALAVPGALILGLAIGAEVDLLAFHTARYFRPEHFGQANGSLYALFLVGGGLGPAIFAGVYDFTQAYQAAFYAAAFLLAVSGIISARLPEPS
jgi:predicted MFS family arabinose efflux permease